MHFDREIKTHTSKSEKKNEFVWTIQVYVKTSRCKFIHLKTRRIFCLHMLKKINKTK